MESSRIPFLEELALFLKGIVTPRIDFVGESSDLSAQRIQLCAGHVQQLGSESLLPNLMEVKG